MNILIAATVLFTAFTLFFIDSMRRHAHRRCVLRDGNLPAYGERGTNQGVNN